MNTRKYFQKIKWLYKDIQPFRRVTAHITLLFFTTLRRIKIWPKQQEANIWIIGEAHGECQPDNGFYFFQYCTRKHPNKDVYFVTRKKSLPKNERFSRKNIINYGSVRHIIIYLKSTVCFYTHTHSDIIFREMFHRKKSSKKLIFLHHSTLGFKKFDNRYVKNRNSMDIFTIGSNTEYDILKNNIGVDSHRLKVTGYARYDTLSNKCTENTIQIAYMPTHRDWLRMSENEFANSDFYKHVKNFILSPTLHKLLENYNAVLKIRLHPANIRFSYLLPKTHPSIQLIDHKNETPLDLIRGSHILITDYSGVAFDFIYLNKPVLFYRFDIDEYIRSRSSYINLRDSRFGDIYYNYNSLIQGLRNTISNNCKTDKNRQSMRDEFMPKMDHKNCDRIYKIVVSK